MTATAEPGRPDDWADTGPIPNTSDTAVWRDRGVIIANLTTENERLRAEVERLRRQHHQKCYQNTGVPDDLPEGLCDCRVLWIIEGGDVDEHISALVDTTARAEAAEARVVELEAEAKQLRRDVAGQTRSAQNGWRTADARRKDAKAAEAKVAAVEALADEWANGGIPCDCGHTLDTHNGLGCYERLSYEPLVTCACKLTDNRTESAMAADILRAALASVGRTEPAPEAACSTCGQRMDSPPCSRSADGSRSGHTAGGGCAADAVTPDEAGA